VPDKQTEKQSERRANSYCGLLERLHNKTQFCFIAFVANEDYGI